jgi:neutral ceramidase
MHHDTIAPRFSCFSILRGALKCCPVLRPIIHALLSAAASLVLFPGLASGAAQLYQVGVAKIDITPGYPVRLTGYASRKRESEGVAQHLWAKALAIGSDKEKPALLITVDNCGVPGSVRDEVVARLHRQARLAPARITICSTHTHSGPWLKDYLPNLFLAPLSLEEQAHIERYTHDLTDGLTTVALQALADRQPARLSRGQGQAAFAANRRTRGGPADRDLPALFVFSPSGDLRAVFTSYACHCTTLGGEFNQVCGDWAGYAQEDFQAEHPGAIALIALGCAGDANPNPRPGLELAKQHGRELNAALDGILTNALSPVEGKLVCRTKLIELPFAKLPSKAEWETRAKDTNYIGSHARLNLARLDRHESLPTQLPYLVQTWTFGDGLAMVFLPGEAVVDYSLRLKREFDASRLWVNAYANDVPCYIPSERILKEGGYEGGAAMVYYDKPAPFAPGIEGRIVGAVHDLLPKQFRAQSQPPTSDIRTEAK